MSSHEPVELSDRGGSGTKPAEAVVGDVPPSDNGVSFLGLFRYADGRDMALMVVGGVAAFLAGSSMPALSFVFGMMIQDLTEGGSDVERLMARLASVMVYVGCGLFVVSFLQVFCWMMASKNQISRIQLKFLEAVMRQDIAWHDIHKAGELTSRMDGDLRVIQNGINDKLSTGIYQVGMMLFGFGFGFYQCWQLTLLMAGAFPCITFVGVIMSHFVTKIAGASQEHHAKAGEIATEVLENVKTVQVFGQEEHEVSRYTAAAEPCCRAGITKEFVSCTSLGLTYFVLYCLYALAFWFSSYLIEWGDANVGEITGTFFSVLNGSFAVGLIFPSLSAVSEARGAALKVYGIIDLVPQIDIASPLGVVLDAAPTEGIVFRDVSFHYPSRPEYPLFSHFNLTIPKGKSVAFSGASGCGKSSLIQLLQRFYDPTDGCIAVDGVDMTSLNLHAWRGCIGIVSQEPSLFGGSIAENVRVGKPDATMEEVLWACKQANIHDLIQQLPQQYDTPVGSVGSQLSGGQKQRLAIARAIIRRPSLLILDEATSALDRKSEVEVQTALDKIVEEMKVTTVVIAHRLATIRRVDTIHFLVHEDGRTHIAESGSYDELMTMGGLFAAMAARQGSAPDTAPAEDLLCVEKMSSADAVVSAEARTSSIDVGEAPEGDSTKQLCTPIIEAEATAVPYLRILRMLAPDGWAVGLALLGSLIVGAMYPGFSVVVSNMVNVLGEHANDPQKLRDEAPFWAALFLAVACAGLVGWFLQSFYAVAGERMTRRLRGDLFRAILRQDAGFFDLPGHDAGAMSSVLSGDCESVHQLWGPSIGFKVQMGCSICAGFVIAMIAQWKLGLVTASAVPVVVFAALLQQLVMVGFGGGSKLEDSLKSETLTNIRTVTSFNMQRQQLARYSELRSAEGHAYVRNSAISGFAFGFVQFSTFGMFALAWWYGGKLIGNGEATFLEVMVSGFSIIMGSVGAGEAGGFAAKVKDAAVSAKRVFFLLDRVPDIDAWAKKEYSFDADDARCDISLSGLGFSYPSRPAARVLDGVSTTFSTATSNGLMGRTGCGKSTIIQLLSRFYSYDGRIMVNGKDLTALDVVEWRRQLSIVLQEPSLFSGSVRSNILYSRPDATDEEVEEAARMASIHDEILLMPDGYETDVGYKGRALSGGQKQRVAIARGLLRHPRVLLLDEATSALDSATEHRVQCGIDEARAKHAMTVITVAHRLTTIRDADKIVVLDGGAIIEEGSHDELMALNGQYRERWLTYQQPTAE